FASNALYPLEIMPEWVKVIAQYNPLTYIVSSLRKLLLFNSFDISTEIIALTIFNIISIVLASKLLSRIIE
ncbi:MAG: ABC transporter permease, partial [Candidatus Micrarchaeia archaeon]